MSGTKDKAIAKPIAGAVLAGGRGERLGHRAKALLPLGPGGAPLIERVLAILDEIVAPVVVSSAEPVSEGPVGGRLEALGRTIVHDREPGLGPLGAIASVLEASSCERVLVVACDMPSLSPRLLARLVEIALEHPEAPAVVPRTAEGLHPLHAVYSRALLPELHARMRARKLALHEALVAAGALEVPEVELRTLDPELASLANVNTPEDLARAVGPERARLALAALRPRP